MLSTLHTRHPVSRHETSPNVAHYFYFLILFAHISFRLQSANIISIINMKRLISLLFGVAL